MNDSIIRGETPQALTSVFDHMSSALLLERPASEDLDRRRCRDLRTSPLEVMLDRELLMAARVGLNLSPVEGLRMRSKNGTDPFLGNPCKNKCSKNNKNNNKTGTSFEHPSPS